MSNKTTVTFEETVHRESTQTAEGVPFILLYAAMFEAAGGVIRRLYQEARNAGVEKPSVKIKPWTDSIEITVSGGRP